MAFYPLRPTTADYYTPFPSWIVDAIPGAPALRDAAASAAETKRSALLAEREAREKLAAISRVSYDEGNLTYTPSDAVTRTQWDRADDALRRAIAAVAPATLASDRAHRAYWEHVMDGQDAPEFAALVEPLFVAATRRAKEHLDALRATQTERAEFLNSLGRTLAIKTGNFGIGAALADAEAYVDAALPSADDTAWSVVSDALDAAILMAGDRARIETACLPIRNSPSLSPAEKAAEYQAVLTRFRL